MDLVTEEAERWSHFSLRIYIVNKRVPDSFIHSTNICGACHTFLVTFVSDGRVGQARLLCRVGLGDPGEVHLNVEPGLTEIGLPTRMGYVCPKGTQSSSSSGDSVTDNMGDRSHLSCTGLFGVIYLIYVISTTVPL